MSGNLFLAWSAVLFALHLRGTPHQARIAGRVLIGAGAAMLLARLAVRGDWVTATVPSIAVFAAFAVVATTWSLRVRAGDRWARVLGWIGVLAFAPNAPYILTDCFHYIQDVRNAGPQLGPAAMFAVQYGWFLVVGAAAWITLLVLGRAWLREHRPGTRPSRVLVPVGLLMALGIYLGRIERFHSWHPIQHPVRFTREVATSFTDVGPLLFTLVWWVVVVLVGWAGVALHDRARTAGTTDVQLLVALAWALCGALLAAAPLVPTVYAWFAVEAASPTALDTAACVVAGVVLSWFAGRHLALLLGRGPRLARRELATRWALLACIALPVAGAGFVAVSGVQWWTQFRGLCEYGPHVTQHGDTCPS